MHPASAWPQPRKRKPHPVRATDSPRAAARASLLYSKCEIALALHPSRAIPANRREARTAQLKLAPKNRPSVALLGLCSGACPPLCLNMGSLTRLSRLKHIDYPWTAPTLTYMGVV